MVTGAGRGKPLPPLRADLLLLHPPALFDFRERDDVYFPFLGTTGDVPITPVYEFFPLGFKSLQRFLGARGRDVKILNLASLLVLHPQLPFASVAEAIDAKLVGIDLYWLIHAQGALAVVEELRRARPDLAVVVGGICATYYADELIAYPFVDMVMRGYDTLEPMAALLGALERGADLSGVPNLLWRSRDGLVHDNGLSHLPSSYACGIDWRGAPAQGAEAEASALSGRVLVTNHTSGCSRDCGWCGGSRRAFKRLYGCGRAVVHKPPEEVSFELGSMSGTSGAEPFHLYGVGSYNLDARRFEAFLDRISATPLKSVNWEQYELTSPHLLGRMARANPRTTLTLSPQSHDLRVARLAGRGAFTNEELEAWIERALEAGIHRVDLWFFVGMPEQDERSVQETVEYCEHLLSRFAGSRVAPMICPMMPLLDPGSTFFQEPEAHGYRVFHRTLEDHRRAALRASIVQRMNYETRWLSRRDVVRVSYQAVRRIMTAKGEVGMFPRARAEAFGARLDDALRFIEVVDEADRVGDPAARRRALEGLSAEIRRRNRLVLYGGVTDQNFPITRDIGDRWCDELGWPPAALAEACA